MMVSLSIIIYLIVCSINDIFFFSKLYEVFHLEHDWWISFLSLEYSKVL